MVHFFWLLLFPHLIKKYMANFPATIYTERVTENLPGIVFNPLDKINLYSDDFQRHAAELIALETKVGVNNSLVVSTLDYLLKNVASINPGHSHNFLSALDGNPAQAVYVDAFGNVGIGTTTPTDRLTVAGSGRFIGAYIETTSNVGVYLGILNDTPRFMFANGSPGQNWQIDNNYGTFRWYLPGMEHMTLNTTTLNLPNKVISVTGTGNNYFAGNVGIGTTVPTAKVDIDSDILRLRTAKTPATAGAAGNKGDIAWDANYIYVCVATNSWTRSAIVAW